MEFAVQEAREGTVKMVTVFSDLKGALGRIVRWALERREMSEQALRKVVEGVAGLGKLRVWCVVRWVRGHKDVVGNVLADRVSRRAVRSALAVGLSKQLGESAVPVTERDDTRKERLESKTRVVELMGSAVIEPNFSRDRE